MIGLETVLIFIVLLLPTTSAWEYNCSGGVLYKTQTMNVNGSIISINENVSCGDLGCASNEIECSSPGNISTEIYISVVIALAVLAFVFALLAIKMSEDHWPLSILFLFSTLLMAVMCIAILMGFSTQTQDSMAESLVNVYTLLLGVLFLFFVYIIITLIREAFRKPKKQDASEY